MTREEAIARIELSATEMVGTLAATTEQSAADVLKRYIDAYDMAISALREQEERSKAEKEGRVVVLPCKEGTYVYTIRWWDDVPETCTDSRGKKFQRMIMKHKVTKEKFAPFGLDYTQFGIKVFLTREEAEKALRRLEEV